MIDFPDSPVFGQVYRFNGRSWVFNGTGWMREPPSSTPYFAATPYIEFVVEPYFPADTVWYVGATHIEEPA